MWDQSQPSNKPLTMIPVFERQSVRLHPLYLQHPAVGSLRAEGNKNNCATASTLVKEAAPLPLAGKVVRLFGECHKVTV